MLEKLWRLFLEYVFLPISGIVKPILKFVIDQLSHFVNWNWRLWAGPIWVRGDEVLLWTAVVLATILELVFEGWLLRRIAQVKNTLMRRTLVVVTVLIFYVVACAQMGLASLVLGYNTAIWPIWIVITILHVVGWALNTVLKAPFAFFWRLVRRLRPQRPLKPNYALMELTLNQGVRGDARYEAPVVANLKKGQTVQALVDGEGRLVIFNKVWAKLRDGNYTAAQNLAPV